MLFQVHVFNAQRHVSLETSEITDQLDTEINIKI